MREACPVLTFDHVSAPNSVRNQLAHSEIRGKPLKVLNSATPSVGCPLHDFESLQMLLQHAGATHHPHQPQEPQVSEETKQGEGLHVVAFRAEEGDHVQRDQRQIRHKPSSEIALGSHAATLR